MASRKSRRGIMAKGLKGVQDARVLPLRQLRPPGSFYRSWYFLPVGMNPDMPESWGLFGLEGASRPGAVLQLHELAPFYGGEIPEAALLLDDYVSSLAVPVRRGGGRVVQEPLKNFVASVERRTASKQEPVPSRDLVHRLHAKAMFALGDDKAARITVSRPVVPSDAWRFRDGDEVGSRQIHRDGHEGTPANVGRLGKLGIPAALPADLRDVLVALSEEYQQAPAKSEDLETVVDRDVRKAQALARWANHPSADDRIRAAARTAEVTAENSTRRLRKAARRVSLPNPARGEKHEQTAATALAQGGEELR